MSTAEAPYAPSSPEHIGSARRPIPGRAAAFLIVYFSIAGIVFATLGVTRFHSQKHWLNDYHFYYDAARLVAEGHEEFLYNPEVRVGPDLLEAVHLAVFPFPATLALVLRPLTLLSFDDGKAVFLGVSIAALALIPVLAYRWSRDWLFGGLVCLSEASLFTTYEALRFSQLAPLVALLLCLAMLAVSRDRQLLGGLALGLLALKPSLLAAPLLFGVVRRRTKWVAAAACVALAVVLVVPLAVVGVDGLKEYAGQLARFRDESFRLDGRFTAGAGWMMNWNGFVGKVLSSDPSPYAVVPLYVLTMLVAVRAWLRTDLYAGFLASTLATLLVIPHAVWYDWLVLAGVAPFALYANRSPALLALLLGLHLSISLDSYVIVTTSVYDRFFFSSTVVAAAILLYLAFFAGRFPMVPIARVSQADRVLESTDAASAEAGPTAGGRTIGKQPQR